MVIICIGEPSHGDARIQGLRERLICDLWDSGQKFIIAIEECDEAIQTMRDMKPTVTKEIFKSTIAKQRRMYNFMKLDCYTELFYSLHKRHIPMIGIDNIAGPKRLTSMKRTLKNLHKMNNIILLSHNDYGAKYMGFGCFSVALHANKVYTMIDGKLVSTQLKMHTNSFEETGSDKELVKWEVSFDEYNIVVTLDPHLRLLRGD